MINQKISNLKNRLIELNVPINVALKLHLISLQQAENQIHCTFCAKLCFASFIINLYARNFAFYA